MKNIIYQYWQGNLKPGVVYSTELMKKYADKIGAEYRFDHNKIIAGKKVNVPIYYEPANPLVDYSFDEYDNVALIDIDVYPKDNLEENLFDQINDKDAAICSEPNQPHYRQIFNVAGITNQNDNRWTQLLKNQWNVDYSYDDQGRPMVYNTGVVVISKEGLKKIKSTWPTFQEYVNVVGSKGFPRFYVYFQDYFSAFIHMNGFMFESMHNGWNSYMHKVGSHPNAKIGDTRTEETKLVHVMFRTADDWPKEALYQVTNLPVKDWKLPVHEGWPNDAVTPNSLVSQINKIQGQ